MLGSLGEQKPPGAFALELSLSLPNPGLPALSPPSSLPQTRLLTRPLCTLQAEALSA